MRYVLKTIKYIAIAFVILVNAAIILRVCMVSDESVLDEIIPTETLKQAYAEEGSALKGKTQSHSILSDNGEYAPQALVYFPEYGQLQVTVRYNTSVAEYYAAEYPNIVSDDTGSGFVFYLEDDAGNVYEPTNVLAEDKYMYHYRRLVFENVDFSKASQISIKLFYGTEPEEVVEGDAIVIYDIEQEFSSYKLSGNEKKKLKD